MTTARITQIARAVATAGIAFGVVGCTEQLSTKAPGTPEPTMDASLVLSTASPATGATVDVFAQIGPVELALEQLRRAAQATQRILDLMREVAHQLAIGLRQR